ncbi:FliM/FliN family flagellar motor switch protein [Caldimonas brevitalea]|uniref:Flagellar motor switch protein FliM n=1 Tax=Caldimonas brevitalea TaxID=413882 RepID=A0A0G3BLV0_9BURK|nr:FliM/FliN family flagellar motor C-terminal domain-containing protein [Caldimonas brevitalea]AKJ30372.1 flagellar motor switch protein FliM [Caldimonas brevitalea]
MTRPTTQPTPHLVLDPSLLGRPVHRLGAFNERWREDLGQWLKEGLNRRYRAAFEVGDVTLVRGEPEPTAGRWLGYSHAKGPIHFAIERSVLLAVLAYRYGAPGGSPAVAASADALPETRTEERLATALGHHLVEMLAARMAAGLSETIESPAEPGFRASGRQTPRGAAWTLRAAVIDAAMNVSGSVSFRLDDAWMTQLLSRLAPPRKRPADPAIDTPSLPQRLQLTLSARLLEKELPLGDLIELRVGDLIPVRLGPTEVLVDDARLFTATVAEHQGKLCLTAFTVAE